jgi:hypothetical protein
MDGAMKKLLIFVVIVGLLAIAGDRVAAKLATDEAKKRLVSAGLTSPEVDVRGFPFLTQLLARHFNDVRVTTTAVRIGTGRADQVSGTARDVSVPSSGPATAGQLNAHGTIPYAEVLAKVDQPGLQLTDAGAGKVALKEQVSALGQTYSVVADARVEAKGDRLLVTPTALQLAGGGAVDSQLSSLINDRFTFSYRIKGLPDGVHIDRITPAPGGFVVDVSGRDVRLVT